MKTDGKKVKAAVMTGILAVSLLGLVSTYNAFEFPSDYIEFRAPDGSRERMSLNPRDLTSDESIGVISEIGVSTAIDKSTCQANAIRPSQMARQIEIELELRSLIDGLMMREKPRQLTPAQKKIIARTPLCEPYLDELKVISRLLNGYDIIATK